MSWPGRAWGSCWDRPTPTRSTGPSRYSYGEATGITQTVRNYGASLGFTILGTILITEFRSRITSSLTAKGLPGPAANLNQAPL